MQFSMDARSPHRIMNLATHLTYASLAGQKQPRERKQLALGRPAMLCLLFASLRGYMDHRGHLPHGTMHAMVVLQAEFKLSQS